MIKIIIPSIITIIYNTILSNQRMEKIRKSTMIGAVIIVWINMWEILTYNMRDLEYQKRSTIEINKYEIVEGIDSINITLITLTNIIFVLMYMYKTEGINKKEKEIYYLKLQMLQIIINLLFIYQDLFIFYIFYELILLPMFILIIMYGSKAKNIEASYKFFLFTLFGSLFLLFGIIYIYFHFYSFNFEFLSFFITNHANFFEKFFLWGCFIISFLIKIPTFPFHIWLPYAHVQASTTSSVILASVLLKIGVYGIIRLNIEMLRDISEYMSPIIIILALISIYNSIIITFRLIDLKLIIAYSSIIHMNLFLIGLFINSSISIQGSLFSLISHGLISSLLFFNVGSLYNRYHTRIFFYFKGLSLTMPLFSLVFTLGILSNISIPLSSAFIGEYIIILGLIDRNVELTLLIILSMVISSYYALWINNRILFGSVSKYLNNFNDLTISEFFISFFLISLILFFGIYPSPISNFFHLFSFLCLG